MRARDESSLNNLLECLNRYKLKQTSEDHWRWNQANNGLFPTKKAYTSMVDPEGEEIEEIQKKAFKTLWGSNVPRRVQAIVWKIVKNNEFQ